MRNALLALTLSLGACTTATSTGIQPVSCPPDSTLTYANFGQAFMDANCLDCHTAKERPTLTSQANIQSHANAILQEAVYTTSMPENADMALSDREKLGEWIACGAP